MKPPGMRPPGSGYEPDELDGRDGVMSVLKIGHRHLADEKFTIYKVGQEWGETVVTKIIIHHTESVPQFSIHFGDGEITHIVGVPYVAYTNKERSGKAIIPATPSA